MFFSSVRTAAVSCFTRQMFPNGYQDSSLKHIYHFRRPAQKFLALDAEMRSPPFLFGSTLNALPRQYGDDQ